MFTWLKRGADSPKQKNAADELSAFLSEARGKPLTVVTEVTRFVWDGYEDGNFTFNDILRADAFVRTHVRTLEDEFFAGRENSPEIVLATCAEYASKFAAIHVSVAKSEQSEHTVALAVAKGIRLLSWLRHLARLSHREGDPMALETMVLMFSKAIKLGVSNTALRAYPDETETSVRSEFAASLLFETAPFENFSRDRTEYFRRFVRNFANAVPLKNQRGAEVPFGILPSGRIVAPESGSDGCVLYVGPGERVFKILQATLHPQGRDHFPEWATPAIPGTDEASLREMAKRVLAVWSGKTPKRRDHRHVADDDVFITQGFESVRRSVAYSSYARSGGSLEVFDSERMKDLGRLLECYGLSCGTVSKKVPDPLEVVEKLSEANAGIERWRPLDRSDSGIGLVIPGYRRWLTVGILVAARESGSVEWRAGIVRRISQKGGKRSVGIEFIPGTGIPVGTKRMGTDPEERANWAELLDGILIGDGTERMLIVKHPCAAGSLHLAFGGGKRFRLKIGSEIHAVMEALSYECEAEEW